MDPPLPASDPLEVLDRVGDVGVGAVDARFLQRLVEQPARRPHERPPFEILLVAWLLPHQDQSGGLQAFAEHRLGPRSPKRARAALTGSLSECRQ